MADNQGVILKETSPELTFTFTNKNGMQAKLAFGGRRVTYSGELSIGESAKMFFEAVHSYFEEAVKEQARKLLKEKEDASKKSEEQGKPERAEAKV